jgi:hypothetical protein
MDSYKIDEVVRGGGPEPTAYDRARHEEMVLKRNGLYGIPKIFVNGFKKKEICEKCDRLKYWCVCENRKEL